MNIKKNGFSLIEIIIAVVALAIIAVVVFDAFLSFRDSSALDASVDTIVATLKQARSQTFAAKNATSYGVQFASSSVTLFQGGSYVLGAPANEVKYLSPLVEISSITLTASSSAVAFQRLTGLPSASGFITARVRSNAAKTKTIHIYPSGLYEIQ